MAELPRAIAPFSLDIKVLGQGWNARCLTPQLPSVPQDDLGPPVILFDIALNFDNSPLQQAHISDMFQIAAKYHYLEGTRTVIGTEIQEHGAGLGAPHLQHLSGDALVGANVVLGFGKRKTTRRRTLGKKEEGSQRDGGSRDTNHRGYPVILGARADD
jgi:hypothetical protein